MPKTNAALANHAAPTSPRARRGRGATAAASKPAKQVAKNRQRGSDHATSKSSKQQLCLELLRRPDGAGLKELQAATGWQAHSVRGFLAGTVKRKLGLTLSSDRTGAGPRRYRIAPEA
jgi:hypothetical protein